MRKYYCNNKCFNNIYLVNNQKTLFILIIFLIFNIFILENYLIE